LSFVFFFQAEDGIRDRNVTGVQTCALPISATALSRCARDRSCRLTGLVTEAADGDPEAADGGARGRRRRCTRPLTPIPGVRTCRSEERRVGKESGVRGVRWWASGRRGTRM